MIALVDCNNFYASCERLFQPKYIGRPVVVLSNNDGCVIARSNEAKALGIEMGALAHEKEKFFQDNGVAVFSSNYTLYGDLSARVMHTLQGFAPEVEIYSIDEAFLDLSGFKYHDFTEYGREIKETVQRNTGIPVSIGMGTSKSLAKAANKYAKKIHRGTGLYVIDTEDKRKEVLQWLPLGDIWGIGHRNQLFFGVQHGVKTAWEFSQLNDDFVRKKMGVVGVRLLKELNGIPCMDMELIAPAKQNICTSRSFPTMLTNRDDVAQAVGTYVTRCGEKLRKQDSCAGEILVFVHTNRFRTDHKQYSAARSIKLPTPSNSTLELMHYAMQAFKVVFKNGYLYKKAGVILNEIVPVTQIQSSLFDKVDRAKETKVMQAMDIINKSMGQDKVRLGAAGYGRNWRLKREKLSNCYTTNWHELLKIKI